MTWPPLDADLPVDITSATDANTGAATEGGSPARATYVHATVENAQNRAIRDTRDRLLAYEVFPADGSGPFANIGYDAAEHPGHAQVLADDTATTINFAPVGDGSTSFNNDVDDWLEWLSLPWGVSGVKVRDDAPASMILLEFEFEVTFATDPTVGTLRLRRNNADLGERIQWDQRGVETSWFLPSGQRWFRPSEIVLGPKVELIDVGDTLMLSTAVAYAAIAAAIPE